MKWMGVLAAVAVMAAGVWGYFALRQAQEESERQLIPPAKRPAIGVVPETPTNAPSVRTNPVVRRVEPVGVEHPGSSDLHGGVQE